MRKNKNSQPLYILFAFLAILFFVFLFSKNTLVKNTENTATVLNGLNYDLVVLEGVKTYTNQANEISAYIGNPLVNPFTKSEYKKQLDNMLYTRKGLIKVALLRGVEPTQIPSLDLSVPENSSGTNLVESKIIIENGQINTLHKDDFINHRPTYEYVVTSGIDTYRLITSEKIGYVVGGVSVGGILFGTDLYASNESLKLFQRTQILCQWGRRITTLL